MTRLRPDSLFVTSGIVSIVRQTMSLQEKCAGGSNGRGGLAYPKMGRLVQTPAQREVHVEEGDVGQSERGEHRPPAVDGLP